MCSPGYSFPYSALIPTPSVASEPSPLDSPSPSLGPTPKPPSFELANASVNTVTICNLGCYSKGMTYTNCLNNSVYTPETYSSTISATQPTARTKGLNILFQFVQNAVNDQWVVGFYNTTNCSANSLATYVSAPLGHRCAHFFWNIANAHVPDLWWILTRSLL